MQDLEMNNIRQAILSDIPVLKDSAQKNSSLIKKSQI